MPLILNNIFESISGECNRFHQGRVTTFIRLQGCNLRCSYCDTPESLAFGEGTDSTIDDILKIVNELGHKHVLITRGEPSIQEDFLNLCYALKNNGNIVTVETNGTNDFSLKNIDCCVVDWKFDSVKKMNMKRFTSLRSEQDVIKFVVKNKTEVNEAEILMKALGLNSVVYAFSPLLNCISVKELAAILIERKANVVLSLQIHKMCDFK